MIYVSTLNLELICLGNEIGDMLLLDDRRRDTGSTSHSQTLVTMILQTLFPIIISHSSPPVY